MTRRTGDLIPRPKGVPEKGTKNEPIQLRMSSFVYLQKDQNRPPPLLREPPPPDREPEELLVSRLVRTTFR